MIRIHQIKIPVKELKEEKKELDYLKKKLCSFLSVKETDLLSIKIVKKSIDARKKSDILFLYTLDVKIKQEEKKIKRNKNPLIQKISPSSYQYHPETFRIPKETKILNHRPIVVGMGPAGLFCGYLLAKEGYRPILLERGGCIEERITKVEEFWEQGTFYDSCNVQFGEGGAGAFSDGKLNTLVKDPKGRNRFVLELLAEHGAPEEILYLNKPHIGTDKLRTVVKRIREHMIAYGAEVHFHSTLTDISIEQGQMKSVTVNNEMVIPCEVLVLAVGHSARDTFQMLHQKEIPMHGKAFAMGLRIEHLQSQINTAQYGDFADKLPPADYKLTFQTKNGRGVYTFCMCPGGFVVNSSSEKGGLCVNGMSNHSREEKNANSAVIVTVKPEDFPDSSPLAGISFQQKWEQAAFQIGKGRIPVQTFGDFKKNKVTERFGKVRPNTKGSYTMANLRQCLPKEISESIIEAIEAWEWKIHGFSNEDSILSGVETRTSSPVRIERNDEMESSVSGLYPCGEGAGYAGGITSAAMDGIKLYEAITKKYLPQGEQK